MQSQRVFPLMENRLNRNAAGASIDPGQCT